MANWKERGEVPDSDDERDFDSQDSDSLPNVDVPTTSPDKALKATTDTAPKSIWDVPESSQGASSAVVASANPQGPVSSHDGTRPSADEPASSPLSSALDLDELADLFYLESLSVAAAPTTRPIYFPDRRDDSPDPLMGDDSISTSYVELTAPAPEFLFENDTRSPSPIAQAASQPATQQRPASQRSRSLGRDEEVAKQAALRYERLLRPRKPIQEHPYLIENAQYSKTLKSHGLRPIRMPTEPVSRQQRTEDDSQEKDFEDSQGTTADGRNETTDESQSNGLEEPIRPGFLRAVSLSSSPLRTSSPKHQGGPSSQASQGEETDNTNFSGNEELPSIDDIFRNSTRSKKRRRLVGPATSRPRSAKKATPDARSFSRPTFQQYNDIYGLVSSSPETQFAAIESTTDPLASPETGGTRVSVDDNGDHGIEDHQVFSPERHGSIHAGRQLIDMSTADDCEVGDGNSPKLDDLDPVFVGESEAGSGSGSESGSDIIKNVGRRIRGVLPASWLRLDQQANRPKPGQQQRHAPSPEKTQRRGVAVRRMGRTTSAASASIIFEDSDDELPSVPTSARNAENDDILASSKRVRQQIMDDDDDDDDDDGGLSAMEDNQIDHMAPGRKRQLTLNESFQQPAKRQKKNVNNPGAAGNLSKRHGVSRGSIRVSRLDPWLKSKSSASGGSRTSARTNNPPRLSILDVIEPDAPRFLKIAARTAQNRHHLGRTGPTNKTIRLATRKDNIDAGTVLQKWRGGQIHPRKELPRNNTRRMGTTESRPLSQLSSNIFSCPTAASSKSRTGPQPTRRQREDVESAMPSPRIHPRARLYLRYHSNASQRAHGAANRPAQLETDLDEQTGRFGFHARKRALDALFRRSQSQSLSARSAHLDSIVDDACSIVSGESIAAGRSLEPLSVGEARSKRPRKPVQPIQVDVDAPRFRHADDPLPTTELPTLTGTFKTAVDHNQLLGLGPFGTTYTQHFETFPLDRGVFFHETTLIGSGRVKSALDTRMSEKLWQFRSRVSFHLGERVLRWDIWNEQVSSEFGILMDGMLDQILKPASSTDSGFDTRDAACFVLGYVQNAMSFTDDAGAQSFVTRLVDVSSTFLSRLGSEHHPGSEHRLQLVDILSHLILIVSFAVRFCQKHSALISESLILESLLKKAGETLVEILLEFGLDEVAKIYDDLQTLSYRERGIRSDKVVPHAWVVLMRVFESLKIPRMSFWDVTYSRLMKPGVMGVVDAQEFEKIWKSIFTLLPLCEFDDNGVVAGNWRHQVHTDGWALPQKLLKRVFQLYRDNPRQSPGFNDYCRALVSRCHYLVDQWGWQKCGGIIGAIFDFFGSQSLSHLRNEEAFRSARFLDHLHQNPSLRVESEDRCFHIFLKLLALAIKRLEEKGLVNDIRNLVARTLPNHDRQYSKEQNVHQHDLAALRNHHDLLCTLFWAAPPDLRPGIHNLEKLVIPASSHKEACLINLRAWKQLARFVAHEESATTFLPLANWHKSVFKQLLDQYNSAAADIQRQFLAMSRDASSGISQDLMNSIVASNKAATMEIMLFSAKSSMEIVQHARSLELARLASSTYQLQQVFQQFFTLPSDFPSTLLQASLTTLERLLGRIESVFNEADDSQDSTTDNTVEWQSAILMLERDLAATVFCMTRCLLSNQAMGGKPAIKTVSSACVEQSVIVSSSITSLFVRCTMMQLSQVFKREKYGLFENEPSKLSLDQRPYLALFLATVLRKGATINLADIGVDILQLWLLTIVQPNQCLMFQNKFGQQLQHEGYPFVPDKAVGFVANPDYSSNRDFFEHAMKWMRKSLQTANANAKKGLLADFSRALNSAMQRMRTDLQAMTAQSPEHPQYFKFVRRIVWLITTYGTGICPVHQFFKEVSKEYSPPVEDPQLQAAVIQSYGLRLSEGDSSSVNALFFVFLNNFKQALQHDRLPQEVRLLREAMNSDAILAFTARMLSAALHATLFCQEAYALVDVLCDALELVIRGSFIPRQLSDESLASFSGLITSALAWATALRGLTLCSEHMHVLRKIVWLINAFQPTLEALSLLPKDVSWWESLMEPLHWFSIMVEGAREHLDTELLNSNIPPVAPAALFCRLRGASQDFRIQDTVVLTWSENIVNDVQRNWVITGPVLTVSVSNRGVSSTQVAHGSMRPKWNMQELATSLHDQVRIWDAWWKRFGLVRDKRKAFDFNEYLIF